MSDNKPLVDKIFRGWSAFYDNPVQQSLYFAPIQAQVLSRLSNTPGPVLDLGCGTGEFLVKLDTKNTGQDAFGLDLSIDMLQKAHGKPTLTGRVATADAHHLPIADNALGAVACTVSFHYYLRPLEVLRDIERVLRPGGRLLLATLSTELLGVGPVRATAKRLFGNLARVYQPKEVRELCREAGFATITDKRIHLFTRLYEATKP